jgi:hypothetical protein
MIEILPQSTDTCLAVHISGKVTGPEYQQFMGAVRERLKTYDRIGLVVVVAGFEFHGDFEAVRKDLKFALNEYKHIHRAAFVGDEQWITWFTRFIGPFTRAEEMHFPAGQIDTALDWVTE